MHAKQAAAFRDYTATFDEGVISQWESQITAWEQDMVKNPDPYEEVTSSRCEVSTRTAS